MRRAKGRASRNPSTAIPLLVILALALLAPGCSLGLDFDALNACPAGTDPSGDQCLCADDRGPLSTAGQCLCPAGATWDGVDSCTCPEGAAWNGEVCACPSGARYVPLGEGYEDVAVCAECPINLQGTGGPFGVPEETIWCSSELLNIGTIGDVAREFVDASIIEISDTEFLVALAEVDTVTVTTTVHRVEVLDTGEVTATEIGQPLIESLPERYLTDGRGFIGIELIDMDGLVVVGSFNEGDLFAFDLDSGAQLELVENPWTDVVPMGTHYSVGQLTVARSQTWNNSLLMAGLVLSEEGLLVSSQIAWITVERDPMGVKGTATLGPEIADLIGGERVILANFRPVRGTENLFILSGGTLQFVDCPSCLDFEDPQPLIAEVTFVPSEPRAVIRRAQVDENAYALGEQAIIDSFAEEGLVFDETDIGYSVFAATASGQTITAASLPLLVGCRGSNGGVVECPAVNPMEDYFIFEIPAHLGAYRRTNDAFDFQTGTFYTAAAILALDEIDADLVDTAEPPPLFAASTAVVEPRRTALAVMSVIDDELVVLADYEEDTQIGDEAVVTSGPIVLYATNDGVELFLLRRRAIPD